MLYLTVKHMPDDVPDIGEEYILAKIDFVGFVDQTAAGRHCDIKDV